MCGIAGIIDHANARTVVEKMTRRLAHRGPDAEGYFSEGTMAFGHRRLSIIDLSEAANQPMSDSSGRYWLTFNGEIYNFRQVKTLLPDYPFQLDSDSELLLAAYIRWGPDCLRHLNGMFVFAIWDREKQELFMARDRLGVKPLYCYRERGAGRALLFASEIRALLASGLVPPKLNTEALATYLQYQSVFGPAGIVEGIESLEPGHYVLYKGDKWEPKPYWKIGTAQTAIPEGGPIAVKRRVRELLTASVERRMVSDVPLGAFLSGGIDSSAIVGLMAECSDQPINTFSITFDEPDFDESEYSNMVAKRFNTRHTAIKLRPSEFLDTFHEALAAMDNPSGDGFNTYIVSKLTRQAGITVALSGVGGDELFAGYAGFQHWKRLESHWFWNIPRPLRNLGAAALRLGNGARSQRMADLMALSSPQIGQVYPSLRQVLTPNQVAGLLGHPPKQASYNWDTGGMVWEHLPALGQYAAAELSGYTLYVLLKDTDQMSMASALEVREPFFDFELVDYVLQVPDALKIGGCPKRLLVESLDGLLPKEIVHRPKKGFSLPWPIWLKGELRAWCEGNLNLISKRPGFDEVAIRQLGRDFYAGKQANNWMALFELAVLEDWLQRNID